MNFIEEPVKEVVGETLREGVSYVIDEVIKNKSARKRSAFVKDTLHKLSYGEDRDHNIMIFNLEEEHRCKLRGIKSYYNLIYEEDNTRFGVRIFEDGTFENNGETGWHNWAFFGRFTRNSEGNIAYFKKRRT